MAAQHVDDTTVPCTSIGHVRAVVAANEASACASYATKTKSAFHYGSGKCAVLCFQPAPHKPTMEECGCEVVSSKRLLGILVDEDLSFEPCLNEALARGWSSFVQMFNAAESAGFSVAILTAEICRRLVPEILFAAPLLVTAPGVEHKLNRLQWRWGRSLLGAPRDFAFPWALVFAQSGWILRLGSVVIEEAAVALAKLFLLPHNHPGGKCVRMALECDFPTWLRRVRHVLNDPKLPQPIPMIYEQEQVEVYVLEAARSDAKIRKDLLRQYRMQVVRPILRQYDDSAGCEARSKLLPGFSFCFQDLCREGSSSFSSEFNLWSGTDAWLWYRCWAVVRITGAWPVCLFEGTGLPVTLILCPGCGQTHVPVLHALAECPITHCIRQDAAAAGGFPDTSAGQSFLKFLLTDHSDNQITFACQKAVGSCFQLLLGGSEFQNKKKGFCCMKDIHEVAPRCAFKLSSLGNLWVFPGLCTMRSERPVS